MSETKQYHCGACRLEAEFEEAEANAAREQGIHDALLAEGLEPTERRLDKMRRHLAGEPVEFSAWGVTVLVQRGKEDVIKSEAEVS